MAFVPKGPKYAPRLPVLPNEATPVYGQPVFDRCRVCALKYADMTHYVCGNTACPSRVTVTCTTGGIVKLSTTVE